MPSLLVNNEPTFFVINNTDLKIDTVDGKDQPDRTAITVYQQQLQSQTKVPIFQVLQKFQKFYKSFFQISKSNVMSRQKYSTPQLFLDIFLTPTLNMVLTGMIFGSFYNTPVHNQVIKYQLGQHTILY